MQNKKISIKNYIYLHVIFLIYSLAGIFSKMASGYEFLSFKFIFFYALALLNMFIYALLWQQILRKMALSTAFANKAVIVVWGILWGAIFFKETINMSLIIGAALIIAGILFMVEKE